MALDPAVLLADDHAKAFHAEALEQRGGRTFISRWPTQRWRELGSRRPVSIEPRYADSTATHPSRRTSTRSERSSGSTRRRIDGAERLARDAHSAAERLGQTDVACEALLVIGRLARGNDLDRAEDAFQRAYSLAQDQGLSVWRCRALHELGTIDLVPERPRGSTSP